MTSEFCTDVIKNIIQRSAILKRAFTYAFYIEKIDAFQIFCFVKRIIADVLCMCIIESVGFRLRVFYYIAAVVIKNAVNRIDNALFFIFVYGFQSRNIKKSISSYIINLIGDIIYFIFFCRRILHEKRKSRSRVTAE